VGCRDIKGPVILRSIATKNLKEILHCVQDDEDKKREVKGKIKL